MILVTGANGQLGRLIVRELLPRVGPVSAGKLVVSARDPAKADELMKRSVEIRQGDFDHPSRLVATFLGVDRLVLISTDGPKHVRIAQHRNAIEAAREAGVGHVYYTSFIDTAPDSPAEFAQVHAATEAELQASGLPHTIFRNTLYADHLPMTIGPALESGVFHLPARDGRVTFLNRSELADAIAAAVTAPTLSKSVYELTGAVAYDYAGVADLVSRATGRPVRYETVTETEYTKSLEGAGIPAWMAEALGGMYTAVATGRYARITQDYTSLTGRAPVSLEAIVSRLFKR